MDLAHHERYRSVVNPTAHFNRAVLVLTAGPFAPASSRATGLKQ